MTRLQWNERAFDLVHGPLGSGQLRALRAAAEAVDTYIRAGAQQVSFTREGRTYHVRGRHSLGLVQSHFHEQFPYNPL